MELVFKDIYFYGRFRRKGLETFYTKNVFTIDGPPQENSWTVRTQQSNYFQNDKQQHSPSTDKVIYVKEKTFSQMIKFVINQEKKYIVNFLFDNNILADVRLHKKKLISKLMEID